MGNERVRYEKERGKRGETDSRAMRRSCSEWLFPEGKRRWRWTSWSWLCLRVSTGRGRERERARTYFEWRELSSDGCVVVCVEGLVEKVEGLWEAHRRLAAFHVHTHPPSSTPWKSAEQPSTDSKRERSTSACVPLPPLSLSLSSLSSPTLHLDIHHGRPIRRRRRYWSRLKNHLWVQPLFFSFPPQPTSHHSTPFLVSLQLIHR